jgi:hypothetical protein
MVFSSDNQQLYEISNPTGVPVVYTIDPNSRQASQVAPALGMIPVLVESLPPFFMAEPFAVDSTGLVLGIQDYGISFDDATYGQNVSTNQSSPVFMQHMKPYVGPIAGGTTSSGFGNAFSLTPSVWYGASPGNANLPSIPGVPAITSPPGSAFGPVNLKMLFPDGIQVFDPLFFSYGPYLKAAVISGASPNGGATAQVVGYDIPTGSFGSSTGTLMIGGIQAR